MSATPPRPSLSSPESKKRLLDAVSPRKRKLFESSVFAPRWAIVNLVLAFLVHTELTFHTLTDRKYSTASSYCLYALMSLFLIQFVYNIWVYFFPMLGKEDLALTRTQMEQFHITQDNPGFKLSPDKQRTDRQHPSPFFPPLEGSFILPSPICTPNDSMNASVPIVSSPNASMVSSTSWTYQQDSPMANVRSRFNSSFDAITDEKSLNDFLKEYEDWEKQNQGNASDRMQSPGNTTMPSFWKPNLPNQSGNTSSILDHSAVFSKISYQLSTPMPGSSTGGNDSTNLSSLRSTSNAKRLPQESLCYRVGIDPIELVNWMQNLRMWISQTILMRLKNEIEETNQFLLQMGFSSIQVGESSVEKLKKFAQAHSCTSQSSPTDSQILTLMNLLPFLEITVHQDYVVDRIKELSKGGAISEYKWNSGGRYKNQEWTDKWPTDSELLMHFVACYLDCRLPPVKGVVDGKVFSTLYYFRMPDKIEPGQQKVPCAIVQVSIKPPHYVLLTGDKKLELSGGRNNLMHSLLFFLHQIKTNHHGILGRVNLGKSGLNILWVIETRLR